ncbi:MAG: Tad domain-containing protein [Actinomycetota bacterium]|nr:Tad domain-containing protein [Actinomycetota bacterium]
MRGTIGRRLAGNDREAGVYAVLYSTLVIILIAFAAIVVDISAVRQDRRLNRSASDSAALGGAALLDPTSTMGAQPYAACLQAWKYMAASLHISVPGGACAAFQSLTSPQIIAKCASANPAEIADEQTIGSRRFRVSWPIPNSGGSGFLNPDLAPGSAGAQPANGTTDGNPAYNGCDRLGVAIFQDQQFGLANAFGMQEATTQVHSVALVTPQAGPPEDVAALNVLNPTDCGSLVTTGGGKVTVGPTLDNNGNATGPGIIAVEANATDCPNGYVIDPTTGQGSKICASATAIGNNLCDGLGLILSHAMDPGGVFGKAYNPAAIPTNLIPTPAPERQSHGWTPVTKHYGCTSTLGSCQAPATNYIQALVTAYGGSTSPGIKHYNGSQSPYSDTLTGAFTSPASLCPGGNGVSTVVFLAPGNYYANCDLKIASSGTVIIQGGTLVVRGAIINNGCLTMNTIVTTCPTGTVGSGATVTVAPAPVHDAILFVQGNGCPNSACINNAGNLAIPQTFVYSNGAEPLNQGSTGLTLWTAPGAGARDGNGNTTLEVDCGATATLAANKDCMDSRFGRLAYWNEINADDQYKGNPDKPNFFGGQGNLSVVGIFFTPRAYFNFTGGGGYSGSAAQFWTDQLNVNGGANLGLSPYESFSLPNFGPDIGLIR